MHAKINLTCFHFKHLFKQKEAYNVGYFKQKQGHFNYQPNTCDENMLETQTMLETYVRNPIRLPSC